MSLPYRFAAVFLGQKRTESSVIETVPELDGAFVEVFGKKCAVKNGELDLRALTNLSTLELADNKIRRIDALSGMKKLTHYRG